jgi:polyisoprenoid-binding protein YceI
MLYRTTEILKGSDMRAYTIVGDRSMLEVSVRRILRGRGAFTRIAGTVSMGQDGTPQALDVSIDARSLRTGLALRDLHLMSGSFLNVRRHPTITYASRHIERAGPDRYTIHGLLRLHGLERAVTLEAELEPGSEPGDTRHARVSGVASLAALAVPSNSALRAVVAWLIGDEVHVTSRVCLTPASSLTPEHDDATQMPLPSPPRGRSQN